jgi:hypothetical protein
MKNRLLFFAFFLTLISVFNSKVLASVPTAFIDCSANGCTKSGIDPLFSLSFDGHWYPDRSITKNINLKNSSPQVREMDIRASRTSLLSNLEDVMDIEITNTQTGIVTWKGRLRDFYNQDRINMGIFNPGNNKNYSFRASMDLGAGNNYQGLESVFNLTLGFWAEEINNTASITGFKYYDLNRNNKWDGWFKWEYKINGWVIFVDKNNNKKLDMGEKIDITKGFYPFPDGKYSFNKLIPGSYNICEIQLPGWESSLVNHATCQQISISSGENKTNINFGNYITPFVRRK